MGISAYPWIIITWYTSISTDIHGFVVVCGGFSTGINGDSSTDPYISFYWLSLSDLVCRPSIIYPSVHPHLITRVGFAMNLQGLVYVISIIMKIIFEPWMRSGNVRHISWICIVAPLSLQTLKIADFHRFPSQSVTLWVNWLIGWMKVRESPLILAAQKWTPFNLLRPWSHLWSGSNWFKHPVIQSPETCRE